MTRLVEFFVPGVPATAGSKQGFVAKRKDGSIVTNARGNPVVVMKGDNAQEKSWRGAVAQAGLCDKFFTGPIALEIELVFVRPKAHFSVRGGLKPSAPYFHTSRPDSVKAARAIEDSLKSVLWRDDSQCMTSAWKRYAFPGEPGGAHIRVIELDANGPLVQSRARAAIFTQSQAELLL